MDASLLICAGASQVARRDLVCIRRMHGALGHGFVMEPLERRAHEGDYISATQQANSREGRRLADGFSVARPGRHLDMSDCCRPFWSRSRHRNRKGPS